MPCSDGNTAMLHPGSCPSKGTGSTGDRSYGGRTRKAHPPSVRSLQVRLEIGVIANLLIDLQAVALTVGDDDRIALRIEVDRGREAETPLRLEALHPTPGLHHVGVGVDALLDP